MTQTEALKLALEAYLCREMPAGTVIGDPKWWVPKIANAIKEALAQPEQEPVAWLVYAKGSRRYFTLTFDVEKVPEIYKGGEAVPLYTTPPQRKPLTDEQILTVVRDHYNPYQRPEISFARAIEAAHGIKG